jgi:hypothetical protein
MGTDFNESILMVNPEYNKNIRSKRQMQLFWMPREGRRKRRTKRDIFKRKRLESQ